MELRVTELDFASIKENLKTFLSAQEEFKDYNFDGSGMSVLLDILAYNTHYSAVLAHLQANEQFLDTAIKRSSVVSIAKTLGYIPRSTQSSKINIDLEVTPSSSPPATLDLLAGTIFTTSINGTAYNFSVKETQTQTLNGGKYIFPNVRLVEGAVLSMSYVVSSDTMSGPFIIPNQAVDIESVLISVRETSSTTATIYTQVTSILDVGPTSKVFWIEETPDGKYSVIFGDGTLGAQLTPGNIVTIRYTAASGSGSNGAKKFALSGTIGGYTTVSITLSDSTGAFGGAERESIDSIRFNAPKFGVSRNRAVTAQDYKALIKSQFSSINSVSVWGGEDNDPPIYGKVFVALEPLENQVITQEIRDYITTSIIKPRSVVSIQTEFVDPEYLYIGLDVQTRYDLSQTTSTSADIVSYISSTIQEYFNTQLNRLDSTFYYSKLVRAIDNSTASIIGSLVSMRLQKRIITTQSNGLYSILSFNNSLLPNTIQSTNFITTLGGIQYIAYMRDTPNTSPPTLQGVGSTGTIGLYTKGTNLLLVRDFGSVDYSTGKITINNVVITGFVGSLQDIRMSAIPQDIARNINPSVSRVSSISTAAIYPVASRNTIVKLDDSEGDIISGLLPGLKIVASPYIDSI